MRNIFSNFFLLCTALVYLSISANVANAQISLTATGGTPVGSFVTLGDAFTAINAGTHTGTIAISVTANTTEPASAVLNASGSGAASYTSVSISPSGGAAYTISGAIAGVLVDLNGADNVTIDGLNTGGNALSFENTSTTATATIRFIGDASNNIIQNTTLLGASSTTLTGTVFFSTGTATGNDNNLITNCTFGGSGANFASTCIYSSGTATAGIENSGNTISNCNIANFFSATVINYGIFVSAGSTDWTISGNKFYQSASRTFTTANTHSAIQISTGNNHSITNNTIGFASAAGTGTYTMLGTIATRFIGIGLAVGTTTASSVQGNTVTAISLSTSSGVATTNGVLCGINVTSGSVNIGNVLGNIIGGSTGTNLLVVQSTTTQAAVVGIHSSSTGAHLISGNTMGGFASQSATAAVAGTITGINISSTPSALSITNNVIGNSTANNMIAGILGTTTGSSLASGINLSGAMIISTTITGNTIQNLSSYGTGTAGYARGIWTGISGASTHNISNNTVSNILTNNANAAVSNGQLGTMGIFIGTGTAPIVNNNTITNVSNLNSGAVSTNVAGISHAVSTNAVISNNQIYSINNASTATSTTLPGLACGVFVRGGSNNLSIFNNMISLGIGQTSNTSFVGVIIYSGGGAPTVTQVFYNTIYIGGTATSGAQPTMCVYRGNYSATAVTFPVDIRNNILENTRTGGTGSHYAIANNYGAATSSATGWGANASNYNALNANPATVGHWTSALGFAAWQTASVSDANSVTAIAVNYMNTANNLHINTALATGAESAGTIIAGMNNDIDANVRFGSGGYTGNGTAPDLGADEFDLVLPNCSSASGGTISPATVNACSGFTTTLASPTATTGTGITYQWKVATVSGGPYVNVTGGSGATTRTYTTGALTVGTYFYILETTCSFGPVVGISNEVTVNVGAVPTVTVSPTSGTYCNPGGAAVVLNASGAATYTWSPAAGLSATTGSTVNATPASNTTYTVLGTAANGCTATATTAIASSVNPTISSTTAAPSSVCPGGSSQLNVLASVNGTYTVGSIPFASVATPGTGVTTLSNTGTAVVALSSGSLDDGGWADQALPFTFNFYGVNYTSFAVSTNGFIYLGAGAPNTYTGYGTAFPSATPARPSIGATYSDLDFRTIGTINYFTVGTAPNRQLVINWSGGNFYNAVGAITTQMIIYESTNIIEVHTTNSSGTNNAVQGIQNSAGTNATTVAGRNAVTWAVATPDAYRFTPPALTYAWSPGTFLNNTNTSNPTASAITATTNYTVSVSFGACIATSSVTITAGDPLTSAAAATPSNTVCQNVATTLNANPVGGGGPYTYAWSGPNSFTSSIINPSFAAAATTDAGTYTVTITDNCGATTTGSFNLVVNALPNVQGTANAGAYCTPGPGVTIMGSGADTYTWSPATGLSATTGTTVTATPTAAVTYTVVGTDANGCTASNVVPLDIAPAVGAMSATSPATICDDTATLSVTIAPNTFTYCVSTHTSGCSGDNISNVTLGNINNNTGTTCGGASHQSYFPPSATTTTTLSTSGGPYSLSCTFGTDGNQYFGAWIDYNQNGLYEASEFLGASANAGASGTIAVSFTVPGNALNGLTRMRIVGGNDAAVTATQACGVSSSPWGETQDYDVTIIDGVDNITYDWSPAANFIINNTSTVFASGITATTTFTVMATNAAGCSNSTTTTVTKSATPISVTASQLAASACSSNTGSAQAVAAGGEGTYTLLWSTAETTGTISNLAASTTYSVTATDGYGCKASNSVTIGQLNPPTVTINDITACNMTTLDAGAGLTYMWNDGSTAQTLMVMSSGTSSVTVTDGNGCTATDNAVVTINMPTTGTDTRTACNSLTWIDGNTYTSNNSTATHTITGSNGCDSVVTLNLTINMPTSGTDTRTACGSYTWIDGNTYTSSNSTATHTLTGANGCDSVVTLNLTINMPASGTDTQAACDSYTWIDGNTYTSSNSTATHTITGGAANGCDSVVTLNLTVTTVDTSVTDMGMTLMANATGATYQWVDCNNGNAPISGETNQSFTPAGNGDYAVEVTVNGCTSMSSCYNVTGVSVQSLNAASAINLYPNPTESQFTVDFGTEVQDATLRILAIDGRVLQQHNAVNGKQFNISLNDYPAAMYFVEVISNGQSTMLKVTKS